MLTILPRPRSHHVRRDGLADRERGNQVHLDEPAKILDGVVQQRGTLLHPRVVDEHIDRSDITFDRVHVIDDGAGVTDVECPAVHRETFVAKHVGCRPKRALVPSVHDELCAGLTECPGEREADASARTGHESDASRQVEGRGGHVGT